MTEPRLSCVIPARNEEALIGAVAEIAENLMPSLAVLPRAKERASYTDLARVYGAASVADPLTLCLPAGSPVGRDTVLEWTPAVRYATGEIVLMPLDVAATDYFELSEGYKPFTNLITNGLGAGPTLDFAIGHGLCELLQRDGNGIGFRAMDRGIALDMGDGPTDPRTRDLLARLREQPEVRANAKDVGQWRRNGAGAQILADLGLGRLRVLGTPRRQVGLAGYGLEVVETVVLPAR